MKILRILLVLSSVCYSRDIDPADLEEIFEFRTKKVEVSRAAKACNIASALILGAGVANAMIPVFLEDLDENGLDTSSFLTSSMIYTGVSFGIETFLKNLPRRTEVVFFCGKTISAIAALLPVYYLFSVENNHHLAAENKGWDEYYTFFAVLAPFLFVNEFLDVERIFKSNRKKMIEKAIDCLSIGELDRVYSDTSSHVMLPSMEMKDCFNRFYAITSFVAVASFMPGFILMWEEFCSVAGELPLWCASILGAGSASVSGFLTYHYLTEASPWDLLALPQGLFKTVPLLALANKATSSLPAYIRYPSLVIFPLFNCLRESKETKEAIELVIIRYLKDKSRFKRQQLKEILI